VPFSVVLDTCALYPAYLRDTLLRLANAGTFRPLWSRRIFEELERNLAELIGMDRARRLIHLMEGHFPDATITGYEPLIATMTNDEKDRHVLAAAVRSNADAIVTFNLDDFPNEATAPFQIDVIEPDAFLLNQIDLAPRLILRTLQRQVDGYRDPAMDLFGLATALERAGCPGAAAELRLQITPE
jgi:predicted nucleic acid-binding protein